ncbi:hypothetical protein U1Q18_045917 [Sarracenia purpurea var. burkii]
MDSLRLNMERLSIAERYGNRFVKAFDEEMKSQFRRVIGKLPIKLKLIHSPTTIKRSNGFLGVFYRRFFVQKHLANIANTDANCQYLNDHAAIFPFPVSEKLDQHDIGILDVIDDKLLDEMQTFLDEHFDGVEIRSICRKFFANILNCEEKNVSEKAILAAVQGMDLKGLSANNSGDKNFNDDEKCAYLESYPRVSDVGVLRYKSMYNMLLQVTELYKIPCNTSAIKYDKEYLVKLPEINFYELYSLLNDDFLRSDRREYVYRFKKYLFFFINALNHPSKPVFFIDDGLFECLQHYNTFKKSRNDVETLKFELSMLTLVFRRKQTFDEYRGNFRLDDVNLKNVKAYFDNFPDVARFLVMNEVHSDVLASEALVSTEQIAMDVCFRGRRCRYIDYFFELIIYAALSPKSIKRLVLYNAFTGEETSVAMPSNKHAINEFIRRHNRYDFSQTVPPERFITLDEEFNYKGDVSKWDSKRKFKY